MRRRLAAAAGVLAAGALVLSGCAAKPLLAPDTGRLQVVTTTGILADLVRNVGGDRVDVVAIVPDGADPHTYEPTLRDARNVVYADVAFSNYALLEEHGIIKTLDANLRGDATDVSLVEESAKYSAELIPLVENVRLDTVWLGLRTQGAGAAHGAGRASDVELQAIAADGPGDVYAYLTGTFGDTDVYFDSSDGFDAANGYADDTAVLPAEAHTHLSWAFTEPGVYHLTVRGRLRVDDTSRPVDLGEATFTFAVGVNPRDAGIADPVVLDRGHADLTVDLDGGGLDVLYDPTGGGDHTQQHVPAARVVVDVPNKAVVEIPGDPQFRFLGRPGDPMHQLPQAVLGKHVHGEIDPHVWQDVRNVQAYVKLIRDTLTGRDPAGAAVYRANADRYLTTLDETDRYVRDTIAAIPEADRNLVSTHDAFAYLAAAYGLTVAGFVTPNPATEPSLADRRRLTETIRNLHVKAVFLEPNLRARSTDLTQVAAEQGVRVCPIYGDTLDAGAPTYVDMMRFTADSLRTCLGP
jgi:anchored repeat ABC transporter substrate-binding protein